MLMKCFLIPVFGQNSEEYQWNVLLRTKSCTSSYSTCI